MTAETQVWEHNAVSPRLAARLSKRARISNSVAEEMVNRAMMLRGTVADAGLDVTDSSADVATTVTNIADAPGGPERFLVEATIERTWVEYDPTDGTSTNVGMTDTYNYVVTEAGTQSDSKVRLAKYDVTPEGQASADEGTGPSLPESFESSTTQPASTPDRAVHRKTERRNGVDIDPSIFRNYLLTWTAYGDETMPSGYPKFSNNCANFISQAYHQAGWYVTGGVNPNDTNNWDYDLTGPAGATDTWATARVLYFYARDKKGLRVMSNIWNAQPGSTYFMDWEGDGVINHVAGVSGRTADGTPRISQKTSNRHNMLLPTWKAIVDGSNPNVKWFGLREFRG
ncbi:amidase domain-containing protein [Nocardioides okcheonensis]|uniref:amidase domain-containing protein n=1 Tax=Nocardioides okcheonensis TaxID=2894081 RepID=UPI001E3E496A|nr:amidase domain-containing protein [Nocardioides okcheonensis]UFN45108.1 amidase domain-containing protein [Nocardioides okcheonensis]